MQSTWGVGGHIGICGILITVAVAGTEQLASRGDHSSPARLADFAVNPPKSCTAQITCEVDEWSKLIASDPAAEVYLGFHVSISRDWAVVGGGELEDCEHCGAVYLYRFDGNGWAEMEKLIPTDVAPEDYFGRRVFIEDEVAIIGAGGADCPAGSHCGAAYVYRFNGTSWEDEAKLVPSDAAAGDALINAVLSGNTALLGATGVDCSDADFNCGAAYVYDFDGSSWVEKQKLIASDAMTESAFGSSVSMDGGLMVIGDYWDDCATGRQCGSAYVFRFDGNYWREEAKLVASDTDRGDAAGWSVSISGDVALVGSTWDDCAAGINCGSAYVYRFVPGDPGSWVQETKLAPSDRRAEDQFGYSVSLVGDTALIGAHGASCLNGDRWCGAVYLFRFDGDSWVQEAKLMALDPAARRVGYSVEFDGQAAVFGAVGTSCSEGSACGAAYVINLSDEDCNCNEIADFYEVDLDGDGIVECDLCTESNLAPSLLLGSCDPKVPSLLLDDGCTMADRLADCEMRSSERERMHCALQLSNQWWREGFLDAIQLKAIKRCIHSYMGRN